jgi:amidohydrolase family protein
MARLLLVAVVLLAACQPAAVSSPSPTATLAPASPSPSPSPSPTPSPTPTVLPIFDAHMHYSRESWTAFPPEKIQTLLNSVSVTAALVSSAPDEGTFRLKTLLGERVVPMLGPYRTGADVFSWTRDGTILPYVEASYRAGMHRGFGEFHLSVGQITLPVVKNVVAFAQQHDLFLQPHADARAVAELLNYVGSDKTVLWAHAGVTATPEQIDALLAGWPKLSVELSLRDDVAPQGQLDPKWRALLLKYSDRFMVGTDTWTVGGSYTGNERWDAYADIVNRIRAWLMELPDDARAAIAYKNAERFLAQLPR